MGKTIQMISLLASDAGIKPNLVIAYVLPFFLAAYRLIHRHSRPTVAIMQWRNEIEAHADGFKVLVWHGSARDSDPKTLKNYDVV